MDTVVAEQSLSADEVLRFHREGYLGPYSAFTAQSLVDAVAYLDRDVFSKPGPCIKNVKQLRYLDHKRIYDWVTASPIVERVKCILGPDLLLWAGQFWDKEPGGKAVPWHQDYAYWPLEPVINVTAWLAITPCTCENACVRFIPGSHRKPIPHVKARSGQWFDQEADPSQVDESSAVPMELQPGEFVLFNERTLHHSPSNESNIRRIGLGIRFTIPIVRIDHDWFGSDHRALLISGKDYMGFNRLAENLFTQLKPSSPTRQTSCGA